MGDNPIRGRDHAGLRAARAAALLSISALLVGCNSNARVGSLPTGSIAPAVAVSATDLEGGWGLASFRNEADRPRTEAEAKAACGNPYQIAKGANGGVLMHLADQTQPQEVFLKTASDGRVFIGPRGQAGMKEDRLVTSYENGVLVTEWMDASARERYGTMLFVRCSAPA